MARADDLYPATARIDYRFRRRIGNSSFHLYLILMKEKHLETILVFVVALVIIFLIYKNVYFLYAAILVGCIGLFIPWLSAKLHWLWMKLAHAMGYVMNRVILSVVFFVFLAPIAFLSRLFRKNPFKSGSQHASYFTERNQTYAKKDLENLW